MYLLCHFIQVDLVSASTAVEVYERVRSINQSAGIVSCSRGKLDPAELEGLGAFDRLLRLVLVSEELDQVSRQSLMVPREVNRPCVVSAVMRHAS